MAAPLVFDLPGPRSPSYSAGFAQSYAPQPPQYTNPFAGIDFSALLESMRPKTGPQMMGEALGANALLPQDMQLGAAGISEASIAEAKNRYLNDNVRPSIEKLKAQMDQEGRGNSTFGGAALAQAQAEGDRQAYYASQDMVDRALNRWSQKRQSLAQVEGGMLDPDQGGKAVGSFLLGTGDLGLRGQQQNIANQDAWMKMDQYQRQNGFWGKYGQGIIGGAQMALASPFAQKVGAWGMDKLGDAAKWGMNKFASPKQTQSVYQSSNRTPMNTLGFDPNRAFSFGGGDYS
jgi:hypothetical protein